MKTLLLPLLSILAIPFTSLQATVLFYEDFSSYPLGSTGQPLVATEGPWIRASSAPHQNFMIVGHPDDASSHALWSNSDNANPSTLPRITSKTLFSLGEGLRIDFSLNTSFTGSGQYTRIGLVVPEEGSETSFAEAMYAGVWQNTLEGAGSSYSWQPGDFNQGQTYLYSWEILPVAEGVRMRLYQDNQLRIDELMSHDDFPFADTDNLRLYLGFRNNNGAVNSYVDWISVTAIPEPAHLAVLLAALLGVWGSWSRKRGMAGVK